MIARVLHLAAGNRRLHLGAESNSGVDLSRGSSSTCRMKSTVNLEAVARRAKVPTVTVSRVLNNNPQVKNTTRVRLMKAVDELTYHPNLHARSLAGGKSGCQGLRCSAAVGAAIGRTNRMIDEQNHRLGQTK